TSTYLLSLGTFGLLRSFRFITLYTAIRLVYLSYLTYVSHERPRHDCCQHSVSTFLHSQIPCQRTHRLPNLLRTPSSFPVVDRFAGTSPPSILSRSRTSGSRHHS